MAAVAEKLLTLEEFREKYAGEKPYFEYWDGRAIQKPMPTKHRSVLQLLMAAMLKELGYKAYPELTLRVSPNWEPIPDVAGVLESIPGEYPDKPVDVAVEILSPDDRFSMVYEKCDRYSRLGTPAILVFDPVGEKAWAWHHQKLGLVSFEEYTLSNGSKLVSSEIWPRLRREL